MNKELPLSEFAGQIQDGMTIGIGGWGPRRKPMALVRELLRSDVKDLTLVAYGGPEIGMLCAAGKVKKLVYGFVSMDFVPLEPFFRKARQAGQVEALELDEGMLQWGLRAAGMRVPFLPTPVGLGTDVITQGEEIKTVTSPYADGEVLAAMPALKLDVALLHADVADRYGNTQLHGPDPFFDEHFARAADTCFVSCESLFDHIDDFDQSVPRFNTYERCFVTNVFEVPGGAHPTSCAPVYGWDTTHVNAYCGFATEDDGFVEYASQFIGKSEDDYQKAVGGVAHITALPVTAL